MYQSGLVHAWLQASADTETSLNVFILQSKGDSSPPSGFWWTFSKWLLNISHRLSLGLLRTQRCYWFCERQLQSVWVGESVSRKTTCFYPTVCCSRITASSFLFSRISYSPKNAITLLTHLSQWAATDIGFLLFFRLKSLKCNLVDCVHIRKMCSHQRSVRWVSLKPRMHCELWPMRSHCPGLSHLSHIATDTSVLQVTRC